MQDTSYLFSLTQRLHSLSQASSACSPVAWLGSISPCTMWKTLRCSAYVLHMLNLHSYCTLHLEPLLLAIRSPHQVPQCLSSFEVRCLLSRVHLDRASPVRVHAPCRRVHRDHNDCAGDCTIGPDACLTTCYHGDGVRVGKAGGDLGIGHSYELSIRKQRTDSFEPQQYNRTTNEDRHSCVRRNESG